MTRRLYRCSIAALFVAALGVAAQETKDGKRVSPDPPEDQKYDIPFWNRDEGIQVRAAAAVFGARNLTGSICTRVAISENVPVLPGWDFDFDRALPLNVRNLDNIQDGRPLPDVRRVPLKELNPADLGFYRALLEAIWRSDMATEKMFEKSADDNKYVVYANLNKNAERYRGKIIPVKGKLRVLRKAETPRYLPVDHLPNIYTGWIIGPTKGAPPFTIVFTQLPEKLFPSEDLDVDVTFRGYFLGLVRFSEQGKKDVVSPYLVGRTVTVHNRPVAKAEEVPPSYSAALILWSFGGIVGIIVIAAFMMLWYRSHDRKINSQLAAVRDKHQPFTLEADVPVAPVVETKPVNGASAPSDAGP